MKIKNLQKKKRAGFTLVEMVLVVTILGTLSGIGFMKFGNVQETSRKNADYITAANLATATNLCLGEYPEIAKDIEDDDNKKSVDILELKNKGYINVIPKSQSQKGQPFSILLEKKDDKYSEELKVLCNDEQFYPKPENEDNNK